MSTRQGLFLVLALLALAVSGLTAAPSAFAHIILTDTTAAPGAYYVSSFRVGHGCGGSATTALRVELPEALTSMRPQPKAGWTIEIERAPLVPPLAGEGGRMQTERIKAITWRGGPLPDEDFDTFGIMAKLPAKPGKLYFPVIQTCTSGEERWVEVPVEGSHAHLTHPAPVLDVVGGAGADAMSGMDMGGMGAAPPRP